MRRRLVKIMPLLHELYGIRPWELDDYTYRELAELLTRAEKIAERREQGRG